MVLSPVQLVVDANTRKVLGAHMVGEHAAEIMQVRRSHSACMHLCGLHCGCSSVPGAC
jgi:hypothetical protein